MGEGQTPDLTRMIRRFEAGDRSPEVLAALNQAAFQAFHGTHRAPEGAEHVAALLSVLLLVFLVAIVVGASRLVERRYAQVFG